MKRKSGYQISINRQQYNFANCLPVYYLKFGILLPFSYQATVMVKHGEDHISGEK